MPDDRILKFLKLLEGASDESQAEMAHLALEAMRDADVAIDVCVGWAEQADKLFELNQALLDRMAAAELPPGVGPSDPEEPPS